jgi:LPXTG-motif cell wall-anchored protein
MAMHGSSLSKRVLVVVLATMALALSTLVVTSAPAGAQYCPGADPRCPSVTGNGTSFGVGDTVELTGHGFLPGTKVDFTISDCGSTVLLGTVVADANYEAHFSFQIPPTCCPGIHDVTLTGTGADARPLVLTYQLTVTGDGCGATGPTVVGNLPRTGGDPGIPVALGIALVLIGGALVLIARKRTHARRHQLLP